MATYRAPHPTRARPATIHQVRRAAASRTVRYGAERVATGHYAHVEQRGGSHVLLMGADPDRTRPISCGARPSAGHTRFPLAPDQAAGPTDCHAAGPATADKPEARRSASVPARLPAPCWRNAGLRGRERSNPGRRWHPVGTHTAMRTTPWAERHAWASRWARRLRARSAPGHQHVGDRSARGVAASQLPSRAAVSCPAASPNDQRIGAHTASGSDVPAEVRCRDDASWWRRRSRSGHRRPGSPRAVPGRVCRGGRIARTH